MTPSQLKTHYLANNPDGQYFTRTSMRVFGDSMANYGCRDAGDCWELYRKRPVKHCMQSSRYFDKSTFAIVHRQAVELAPA